MENVQWKNRHGCEPGESEVKHQAKGAPSENEDSYIPFARVRFIPGSKLRSST